MTTSSLIVSPGRREFTTSITSSGETTFSPSTSVITSPIGTGMPRISFSGPPRIPARYAGPPRLSAHDGAHWHLHVDRADDAPWDAWLLASGALALAVLLASAGHDRPPFGTCDAADCRMCYLDSGRGGGRRYCSPRCATRTRVAAFRARGTATT